MIPDNKRSSLHLVVTKRLPRSVYQLSIGTTYINVDQGTDSRASTGSFDWTEQLSRHSQLAVRMLSELTDTSSRLLNVAQGQQSGDVQDQISSGQLRNKSLHVEYKHDSGTLISRIFTDVRKQDYQGSTDDRNIKATGIDFKYAITQRLAASAYAKHITTELTNISQEDRSNAIGTGVTYKLSRQLRAEGILDYRKRNSNGAGNDYEEWNLFVKLIYGFGNINRPGGGI